MLKHNQVHTNKTHNGGKIHCIQNNKSLSWIYCNKDLQTVILIDPLAINSTYISLIEEIKPKDIFVVLTACERKKQEYIPVWQKIYDFVFFVPHGTHYKHLIKREKIYNKECPKTIYCANQKHAIAQIIGSHSSDYHTLMLYITPYLFAGVLLQEKAPQHNFLSQNTRKYIHDLPAETIVLPSLGPISTLSYYHGL